MKEARKHCPKEMLYFLTFSVFLHEDLGLAEVRMVGELLLLTDLGLYETKGHGAGQLGEGGLSGREGCQHNCGN